MSDHKADPVWGRFYSKVVCRTCGKDVVGDGSIKDPWRHRGEKP